MIRYNKIRKAKIRIKILINPIRKLPRSKISLPITMGETQEEIRKLILN